MSQADFPESGNRGIKKHNRAGAKILVLIDWDNIILNMAGDLPEKFSPTAGFQRFKNWLEKIGEIFAVFVFGPERLIFTYLEFFYDLGFYVIPCPKIKKIAKATGRVEEIIDTTDKTMIRFGKLMIDSAPEITHICIGSGDYDFGRLAKAAKKKDVKIMIMAADLKSLSRGFAGTADKNQEKESMIHIFNPVRD